jgi:oligoendopeptidase F
VPRFLEFLAAGGSRSPRELACVVDIDLDDAGFWASGLDLVESQVQAVEDLAQSVEL